MGKGGRPGARGAVPAGRRPTPELHPRKAANKPRCSSRDAAPRARPTTAPPIGSQRQLLRCGGRGRSRPCPRGAPQWPPAVVLLVSRPPCVWLAGAQDCLASGHASALLGPRVSQSAWPSSFLESLNLTSAGSCTSSSGSPLPSLPGEMKAQPLGLASGISKRSHLPSSLVITVGPCPRALKLSR